MFLYKQVLSSVSTEHKFITSMPFVHSMPKIQVEIYLNFSPAFVLLKEIVILYTLVISLEVGSELSKTKVEDISYLWPSLFPLPRAQHLLAYSAV